VLDRLLDLMLVSALRSWFENPDAEAPAWCRALDDPVVGVALRLLHDAPSHPWTVGDLADKVGISRAGFARRFTALVGEPPMAYLTSWRITLAADLLRETDHTVGTIARKVGYANAFALSVAFKRLRGIRPETRAAGQMKPADSRQRSAPGRRRNRAIEYLMRIPTAPSSPQPRVIAVAQGVMASYTNADPIGGKPGEHPHL
jgi:AraC-like DNA-binding protein